MSETIDNIYTLYNNPFLLFPLILEFCKEKTEQPNDVLLSYLVLPLVLNESSKNFLINSNKKSSLATFRRKKELLVGLPDRISEYKEITNHAIQFALDNKYVLITEATSVQVLNDKYKYDAGLQDSTTAAKKLAGILKDLDIITIFRMIGVKRI